MWLKTVLRCLRKIVSLSDPVRISSKTAPCWSECTQEINQFETTGSATQNIYTNVRDEIQEKP